MDSRKIFCSRSCAASYNNIQVPKRKRNKTPKDAKYKNGNYVYDHICLLCKRAYTTFTQKSNFCSTTCKSKNHFITKILPSFFAGTLKLERYIRKCVWYTQPHVCKSCGVGVVYNNLPLVLQVDHIDGNSDNNLPSNLRLLCPNCHTQTPTLSAKNKGSGRTSRKLYRNSLNVCRNVEMKERKDIPTATVT